MPRLRLIHSILFVGVALGWASCAKDIDTQPPLDPSGVTVAQFDPTNPIPVLTLVPSPTRLAEKEDGSLDVDSVMPAPCELPDVSQCVALVAAGGWPLSVPITLYFSAKLNEASIGENIKLYEVGATGFTEIPFTTTTVDPRPSPNASCQEAGNGSEPALTYTVEDVPGGISLVLTPTIPVKPRTQYIVAVESGLKDEAGNLVEASGLFTLLNTPEDEPPVTETGIESALLRSQVTGAVISAVIEEPKLPEDLTEQEKAEVEAAVAAKVPDLLNLYKFFSGTIQALQTAGKISARTDVILTNTWTYGGSPTEAEFDAAAGKYPFPNNQLMTRPSTATRGGLIVSLPPDPNDSPSAAALKQGLNTLNGFSTTGPMVITFSRGIQPQTLQDNIMMYPVNDQGVAEATAPVPILITATSSSADEPVTVLVQPLIPLAQNQNYVVGIKQGVLDVNGNPVVPSSQFTLMKIPQPFIDSNNEVMDAVEQALQCSTVAVTGELADDTTVQGLATQLEHVVGHQRWLEAFTSLEGLSTPIPRTEVLMAWYYKTQSLTDTVDMVKAQALAAWEMSDGRPRVVGPIMEVVGTSSIADLMGIVPQVCVGFCQAGATPPIPINQCETNGVPNPALESHPTCQLAINLTAGSLDRARLYLLKAYRLTEGSPLATGAFSAEKMMSPDPIDLPFWVITGTGTVAADGHPIAIFQHGLGSIKEHGFLIANNLAKTPSDGQANDAGWATILLDFPLHGARASDLVRTSSAGTTICTDANGVANIDPADVQCDSQTKQCVGGCDGIQDDSGTGLLSPNVFGVRDHLRQGVIDQLVLIRTLQAEAEPGGALDYLDGSRMGYIGMSLGGISGGNLAAYLEPDEIEAMVLNVAGGSWLTMTENILPKYSVPLWYGPLAQAGICTPVDVNDLSKGCVPDPTYMQFRLTANWVLDPADPYSNSIAVTGRIPGRTPLTPDNILIQMAMPDPVVVNQATHILGMAYGFIDPTTMQPTDERFSVYDFTQAPQADIDSGCHGFLIAPTCGRCVCEILCMTIGAQMQAAGFIANGGSDVPAQVPPSITGLEDCTTDPCQACPF